MNHQFRQQFEPVRDSEFIKGMRRNQKAQIVYQGEIRLLLSRPKEDISRLMEEFSYFVRAELPGSFNGRNGVLNGGLLGWFRWGDIVWRMNCQNHI